MSKVVEFTSALTPKTMQVFDFSRDPADPADNQPVPVASNDSYSGPDNKSVSFDFNSLLNGGNKTTQTT